MYSVEKYSKTRGQRFYLPLEMNPKIIINAIRGHQHHPKTIPNTQSTNQARNLQVNGQEVHVSTLHTQPPPYNKVRESNLRKIKHIMNQPINKVVQAIENDPDIYLFDKQLKQLQKLKPRFNPLTQTQIGNCDQTQSEKAIQYYEQIILDNPVLYKKVINAYQNSKRQLDRDFTSKKKSLVKDSPIHRGLKDSLTLKGPHQLKRQTAINQYRQFLMAINISNCLLIPPTQTSYKAFITKGNNGVLVKSILKTRPWWSFRVYSEVDSCNLVWTEWKRNKIMNNLPTQQQLTLDKKSLKITNQSKSLWQINKRSQVEKIIKLQNFITNQDLLKKPMPQSDYLPFTSRLHLTNYEENSQKFLKNVKLRVPNKDLIKIVNHVPGCLQLHSKKLLYLNMKKYYLRTMQNLYDVIPLTFLVHNSEDPQFNHFIQCFEENSKQIGKQKNRNIWIIKPGENSNRGNGITVSNSLNQIKNLVKSKTNGYRTLIIQKYIENPFLYLKRKFDIRCYILVTTVNGILKGYWYEDAYIRTASKQFSLKNLENKFVHLTNDAIQKKGQQYGKFQYCNKMTLSDFQKYISSTYGQQYNFASSFDRIKEISTDLIKATAYKLNSSKKQYSFEIFGLDYMLDQKLNPFLIEANSNPCIQVDGPVLGKIIPCMIQNALRIALDPLFPPPFLDVSRMNKFIINNSFQANKFVLVYDSLTDDFENYKNTQDEVQIDNQIMNQDEEMEQL